MAFGFNGVQTNYLTKAIPFSADVGTAMGWCRIGVDRNSYNTFFFLNDTDNAQWVVQTAVDGVTLACYIYDNVVTGASLVVGTLYHITATWDGSSARVYLNGALNITNTATGSDWTQVTLGRSADFWDEPLNGSISDVMAWDTIFTPLQIRQQMLQKRPITFSKLKLWCPTLPGTGERNRDYSGQNNHLTANGTITDVANPPIPWQRQLWMVPFIVAAGGTPVTVEPETAATKVAGVSPTVVLGAVTITPGTADTKLAGVSPTVVVGAPVTVTPASANTKFGAVDPTVEQGSAVTVTPAAAAAGVGAVSPTVVHGAIAITPTASETKLAAVSPTVVVGAPVTVAPAAATTVVTSVSPTVVRGAITLAPAAAATKLAAAIAYALSGTCTAGVLVTDTTNSRYFRNSHGIVVLAGFDTWHTLWDGDTSEPIDAFDYTAWLDYVDARGTNWHKLWAMESARDWDDVVSYYGPHYYQRTGPGNANDGKLKFNCTLLNQAYFDRLRERVVLAGARNHYVCVQLFQGWQIEQTGITGGNPWDYHPFNSANNINSINGDANSNGNGNEVHSTSAPAAAITAQRLYVAKVLDTLNDLDNVIYEICNEDVSVAVSWQWQKDLVTYCHSYEAGLPNQHPIGATHIWSDSDSDLIGTGADWISSGNGEDMADMAEATGDIVRCLDTDHIVGLVYTHEWVWQAFCRGNSPWYMDEYNGAANLYGVDRRSETAVEKIRWNLGRVLEYAARIDLATATPQNSLASTGYCLAKTTGRYQLIAYQPGSGNFTVNLTSLSGTFALEWLRSDSVSTVTQSGGTVNGGAVRTLTPPWAGEDAVAFLEIVGIMVTPAAAATKLAGVSPTVVHGQITIVPASGNTRVIAASPTVVLGQIVVVPAAAATKLAGAEPSIVLGAVSVVPAAAATKLAGAEPAVVLGAITLTPVLAATTVQAVAPTVVHGAIAVTPAAAATKLAAEIGSIQVGAAVTVGPEAAVLRLAAADPSITEGGAISVAPAAASLRMAAVAPAIVLGAVSLTPAAAATRMDAVAPTVVRGAIVLVMTAASTRLVAGEPTVVRGTVTVIPAAAASRLLAVTPTVAQGPATITPAAAGTRITAVDPTIEQGMAVVVTPEYAGFKIAATSPAIVLGAVVVEPAAASVTIAVSGGNLIAGVIVAVVKMRIERSMRVVIGPRSMRVRYSQR